MGTEKKVLGSNALQVGVKSDDVKRIEIMFETGLISMHQMDTMLAKVQK